VSCVRVTSQVPLSGPRMPSVERLRMQRSELLWVGDSLLVAALASLRLDKVAREADRLGVRGFESLPKLLGRERLRLHAVGLRLRRTHG
jgi:hypothetical protein